MCLRKMPSNVAGSASSARRDSTFLASVLNSTRIAPQRSKACSSISSLASTLAPLDQAAGAEARAADRAAGRLVDGHERDLASGHALGERLREPPVESVLCAAVQLH